jgi:mycofactocin precursor
MSHATATPARTADVTDGTAVTGSQVPGPSAVPEPAPRTAPQTEAATPLITQDLLVEEVSIDGMCGVY